MDQDFLIIIKIKTAAEAAEAVKATAVIEATAVIKATAVIEATAAKASTAAVAKPIPATVEQQWRIVDTGKKSF